MMRHPALRILAAALPLASFATNTGLAQSAPPASAPTATAPKDDPKAAVTDDKEVVVLSPFVVTTEKDKGYRATNSTSGTRLDTAIKDLPINLEVITSEFIRDTGATNLRQALRYSSGVVLDSQADALSEQDFDKQSAGANDPRGNTRKAGDSTTKMRGFIIDQVLRDGFRRVRSADAINIDRVEVLRGPSALLYGVGSFGGVINFMPKKPLQENRVFSGVSIGENGLYRGELDVTGPMGGGAWKPAYRLTAAYQESGDFTELYNRQAYTVNPVFSFQPFKNTTVLIDTEFGHENQTGVGFQNIRSNLNTGASRTAGWLTDVSNGLINTRTFRWSGKDTYLKGPYSNLLVDVQQKFSDNFFARVGVSRTRSVFDSRQISDVGTATEPFLFSDSRNYNPTSPVSINGQTFVLADAIKNANANGTFQGLTVQQIAALRPVGSFRGDNLYGYVAQELVQNQILPGPPATSNSAAIRYLWSDYDKTESRDQVRADVTYKLDLGDWGKHSFIAGLQYMALTSDEDEYGPGYSYNGHPVDDVARYSYKNPGDYGYFRYGVQGDGRPDAARTHLFHSDAKTWDLGYFAVYQGQFWKDRITTVAGIRRDRNDATSVRKYIYEAGHADDDNSRSLFSAKAPTATTPQAGLSFALTKQLSLFGLYSTGVVPNYTAQDGNGQVFAPTKAKNKEVGLKFDVLDGRISGTVSAFEITRKNTPRYLWWAPAPYKSVQNGFDSTKPVATVWRYAGPESLWWALHNVSGGLATAKKIYSSAWWSALDALAAAPTQNDIYSIPAVQNWWSYNIDANGHKGLTRDAEANTDNSSYTGNYVFPLINIDDPKVWEFVNATKFLSGQWGGNFYYTKGQQYQFGDGTKSIGNAPDGSGAAVPIDDKSQGWDLSIVASPTDQLQISLNFAHATRRVTSSTYKFVKAPYWPFGWWYVQDGYFGTLSYAKTASQVYTDVKDTTTYHAQIPDYNQSEDDTPANKATIWVRYSLDKIPRLKGWTVGGGGYWEDKRQWFTGFTGGGGNITQVFPNGTNAEPVLVQLWTKPKYLVNTFVEYRTKLDGKYNARFALNIDNLLDNQKRYGQVYEAGRSVKFTAGVDF